MAQRLSVGFQFSWSPVPVPEVTLLLWLIKVLVEEEEREEDDDDVDDDDDDDDDDEEAAASTSPLVDESLETRQEGTPKLRQPMKGTEDPDRLGGNG